MSEFQVRVLAGGVASGGIAMGIPAGPNTVQAESRAAAYIALYRQLSATGQNVTVSGVGGPGNGRPLGFAADEVQYIEASGIPLVEALGPEQDGLHIDSIEPITAE